jgi:hypothetical protein
MSRVHVASCQNDRGKKEPFCKRSLIPKDHSSTLSHKLQVGCLAYELLVGRAPYELPDVRMTAVAICQGELHAWPAHISQCARSFIQVCLHKVCRPPEQFACVTSKSVLVHTNFNDL